MNLGKAIKLCRTSKGFTLEQLADKSKISVSYLSLLERNMREANIALIKKIAQALDIPFYTFMFLAADPSELTGLDEIFIEKLSTLAIGLLNVSKN